eukprot:TRINITY_DN3455_c0_g1_i1.p2 TRINITY_DN3455_c0_g1~~TRINITY_DN3455_c0_g1_i1.p2  ORF type:complete len:129 (+),score=55.20 TRINITY_DN3455_c0_g1_i1:113-499(+)
MPKNEKATKKKKEEKEEKGSEEEEEKEEKGSEEEGSDSDKGKSKKRKAPEKSKKDSNQKEEGWELGGQKKVSISLFRNQTYVDIRAFYSDKTDGSSKPTKKGISLSVEQWEALKGFIPKIDEELKKKK